MQAVFLCLVALMIALFITLLYCALCVASDADDRMEEIMESRLIVPEVTPVPAPAEEYVRYGVNLDDDLQKYIQKLCREYEIPASIVMAVIVVESDCDPKSMGDYDPVNDVYRSFGLMQIWETEHHDRCLLLDAYNLRDPYQNVRVGIDLLAELTGPGWYENDWKGALSFYNNDWSGAYADRVLTLAEQLAESTDKMD